MTRKRAVRSAPSDVSKLAALPAYLVGQTTRRTGCDSFSFGLNWAKAIDLRSLPFGTGADNPARLRQCEHTLINHLGRFHCELSDCLNALN